MTLAAAVVASLCRLSLFDFQGSRGHSNFLQGGAGAGGQGTQHFLERALGFMHSQPKNRCEAQSRINGDDLPLILTVRLPNSSTEWQRS